ncbi:caspase family protein [Streptomyces sp. NPDC051211]|uniref:caspase family protein n=1 Tax=Streptomyces sp. NPDC051211 TaxID=3154643 RepID=UPI00344C8159
MTDARTMTDGPASAGAGPSPDGLTRHLFTFGTGHYPADPALHDLPGAEADLRRVNALFEDLGYRRILSHLGDAPDARQILAGLEDWLRDPARTEHDVLTVYYAGHGLREPQHRLSCRTSRLDRPAATMIRTGELAELLAESRVGHVLMMLDTCYGELGAAGIAKTAADLVDVRPAGADGLWLLASARSRGIAHDHAFVDGLEHAVRRSTAGMRPPYLDIATITARINAHLAEHRPDQTATFHAASGQAVPPFFPNREHRPGLPEDPLDVEAQREWTAHFDPRGRGVEYASEQGDHFTGRRQALAALAGWLRAPLHDARARVVTGAPGSGKSAVLGRLLALARPNRPAAPAHLLPPTGCVTAAVHAHGITLEQLTARLTAALGVEADTPAELLARLAESDAPLRTVVIDALDEAGTGVGGREPQRIARELLRPLSALPRIRLIVGTRRSGVADLGRAVEIIDLDTDAYTGRDDIGAYALALLPDTPERAALARAVTRRAGRSFLVARMTVRALALGDLTVDVTRPGWEADLPSEVGQAFDAYLARYGDDESRVRRLLRPLAYAEGAGLPWDSLWAPLAGALSGVPCTDDDVDWLLRHAGAYVLEVPLSGDRSVFRLYHEALAEHLRDPRRAAEDQRRMTSALLTSIPTRPDGTPDWARSHPYVRAHLPGHAAASGDLERLLEDPWFLVHADPPALLAALEGVRGPEAGRIRTLYRASAHLYAGVDYAKRTQVLAIDAARHGVESHRRVLAERLEWAPRWATGGQTSPYFHAELTSDDAAASEPLAVARLDGRDVLLTDDGTGAVDVWDPADRTRIGRLEGHTKPLSALASTTEGDTTFVVSASFDHTLKIWDLAGRAEPAHVTVDGTVRDIFFTEIGNTPVFVGSGDGGRAWVRDLATGALRGCLPEGLSPGDGVCRLLHVGPAGEDTVAFLTRENTLFRWSLTTGTCDRLAADPRHAQAIASTTRDGVPFGVFGWTDGTLDVWDLAAARRVASYSVAPHGVAALTIAEVADRQLAVVGCTSGAIELRDLADGSLVGRLNGHEDWIDTVVTFTMGGACFAVSGSADGSVRLWSLDPKQEPAGRAGHLDDASAVACTVVNGAAVAVTGSHDHTVRVWDLSTGRQVHRLVGHCGWVGSVSCITVAGEALAVAATHDRSVRIWGLAAGSLIGGWGEVWADTAACCEVDGRAVVLTGDAGENPYTQRSAIRDLATGAVEGFIGTPLGVRGSAACFSWDGAPIAAIAGERYFHPSPTTVRLWNLAGQELLQELDAGEQINAVASGSLSLRPVVVAATLSGTLVWDVGTGRKLHDLPDDGGWVSGAACGVLDGTEVVVTAGWAGVCIYDLATGRLLHHIALPLRGNAVAFGAGGELVVCAGFEVIVLERRRTRS